MMIGSHYISRHISKQYSSVLRGFKVPINLNSRFGFNVWQIGSIWFTFVRIWFLNRSWNDPSSAAFYPSGGWGHLLSSVWPKSAPGSGQNFAAQLLLPPLDQSPPVCPTVALLWPWPLPPTGFASRKKWSRPTLPPQSSELIVDISTLQLARLIPSK